MNNEEKSVNQEGKESFNYKSMSYVRTSEVVPVPFFDAHKKKIIFAFNAATLTLIAMNLTGVWHEGRNGRSEDIDDQIDQIKYGVNVGVWGLITAVGNIAFYQRTNNKKQNHYEKRPFWNWCCPARFDLPLEYKEDHRDEESGVVVTLGNSVQASSS